MFLASFPYGVPESDSSHTHPSLPFQSHKKCLMQRLSFKEVSLKTKRGERDFLFYLNLLLGFLGPQTYGQALVFMAVYWFVKQLLEETLLQQARPERAQGIHGPVLSLLSTRARPASFLSLPDRDRWLPHGLTYCLARPDQIVIHQLPC